MNEPEARLDKTRTPTAASEQDAAIMPLLEEQLLVAKREVETGTVHLRKHVEQQTETVAVPLEQVTWQIERVPVEFVVAEPPAARQEGDTTIYSVTEERVVLRKELVVREEVRVTRVTAVHTQETAYTVAREVLDITRSPASIALEHET